MRFQIQGPKNKRLLLAKINDHRYEAMLNYEATSQVATDLTIVSTPSSQS